MAKQPYFTTTEWAPGAWRIFSPVENVHCDLLVGDDRALLIDTGYGIGDLPGAVAALTDKPLTIANTHGHVDHACGNCLFDQEILIHPRDMALLAEHTGPETRRGALAGMLRPDAALPEGFDVDAYAAGGGGRTAPVEEGAMIDLGGKTIEVVELPGHTAGSIGFIWREERVLFCGDAANGFVWLFLPESQPLATYIGTLRKIKTLPVDRLVQSHPAEVFDAGVIDAYIDVAEHVDWEHGTPFTSLLAPAGTEVRICCAQGTTFDPQNMAATPALVIDAAHL